MFINIFKFPDHRGLLRTMFTNTFNPPDRIATPGMCQQLLQLEDYHLL